MQYWATTISTITLSNTSRKLVPTRQQLFQSSRLFLICFLTCCLLTIPLLAKQASSADTEENEVSNFRIKIRRLQQGIFQQKSKISETQEQERYILAELENLDKRLAEQLEKMDSLNEKEEQQQRLIDKEEIALNKIRHERSAVEAHLKKRITAYYTMGNIGIFNVTFSTKSLPELLRFHDAFDQLIKYDQDVILIYKDTIDELERVKAALDLEKTVLEGFISQAIQEKEVLEETKTEKGVLLTHVRTQSKLHKHAILEMQQASQELSKSLVAIKNKEEVYENNFLANKGSLPPPIDGMLVTKFQQEKVNKLGITRKSQGIELQAPDGTEIVSVDAGDVIFAGYLRGYGNTVIIHHGVQYYTVTSRIEKIVVKKGQRVKRKQKIGIMGDTATLFDEGLYFELRHGRTSMDPLLWLNPSRLSTYDEHATDLLM